MKNVCVSCKLMSKCGDWKEVEAVGGVVEQCADWKEKPRKRVKPSDVVASIEPQLQPQLQVDPVPGDLQKDL